MVMFHDTLILNKTIAENETVVNLSDLGVFFFAFKSGINGV